MGLVRGSKVGKGEKSLPVVTTCFSVCAKDLRRAFGLGATGTSPEDPELVVASAFAEGRPWWQGVVSSPSLVFRTQ